jgi:hypothetical protein
VIVQLDDPGHGKRYLVPDATAEAKGWKDALEQVGHVTVGRAWPAARQTTDC